MLNQVSLVGRLVRDPKLKVFSNGNKKVDLIVAVDRGYKNKDGEQETDFIFIEAWRNLADQCAKYLEKGRLISVEGRIRVDSWEDEKTGDRKYKTGITARNVQFLDRPNKNIDNSNEATA
ncbi:single-stranded DNA-binding protein [Halonatronum saccharophilum]|uniref:single-stranded DNA-binding protein n=1 Tax=Halonatronum saccharophilum TaxID=150060 RepID=UPI0004836CAD|nr:single-stranded DNA-binding protein [Halonatronum saccharophilum]